MSSLSEIRTKYPEYDYLSDRDLADKLHAKFYSDMDKTEFDKRVGLKAAPEAPAAPKSRSWSDVPGEALQNLGPSALRFGEAVAQPIMHPIDTAKNLGLIIAGGTRKAAQAVLPASAFNYLDSMSDPNVMGEADAKASAVVQFFKDRYGSAEALKATLATDPVGAAADAATVLTGGGAALARAPGTVGRAGVAIQSAGTAIDPLQMATRAGGAALSKVAAPVAGALTGTSPENFRIAAQAGMNGNREFVDHMRGNADINAPVATARDALGQIRQDRSAAYNANMASVKASPMTVNMGPIGTAITDAENMVYFNGLSRSGAAEKVLDAVKAKVDEWRNAPFIATRSPEGIDALKQAIGEIRQATPPRTLEREIADHVYRATKAEIVRQAPEYAKAMGDYSKASEVIDELTRTLSLGEKAASDTALRKLQSTTRNNVNTNYGARAKLLDELAKHEPDLPYMLAGQSLNSPMPRGLAGMGPWAEMIAAVTHANPMTLAVMPFQSPRLMGEAAHAIGKGGALAHAVGRKAKINKRRASAGVLGMFQAGRSTSP